MGESQIDATEQTARRRRRRRLGCLAFVLAPLIAVAVLVAIFVIRILEEPQVTRNYLAEFNERYEGVPESDKAWPLYREAHLMQLHDRQDMEAETGKPRAWSFPVYPGWTHWDDACAWLERNRASMDLIRAAAHRPMLGRRLSVVEDPEWMIEAAKIQGTQADVAVEPENPTLFMNLTMAEISYFDFYRHAVYALSIDAFRAMEQGDSNRALSNIESILGIASHAGESTLLIGHLTGIAFESLAQGTIIRILDQYSELFDDEQLDRVQRAFVSIGRDSEYEQSGFPRTAPDFSIERAQFHDFVQRTFSDKPSGNGHLVLHNKLELTELGSPPGFELPDLLLCESRNKLLATHDDHWDRFEQALLLDRISKDQITQQLVNELDQYQSSLLDQIRYARLIIALPDFDSLKVVFSLSNTWRKTAITVIALHRYKNRHGSFPESIEALVPDFLDSLPADPVDEKPLRYRLTVNGPVLYSIGADGIDNGGEAGEDELDVRPYSDNPAEGDWVFYPIEIETDPMTEGDP